MGEHDAQARLATVMHASDFDARIRELARVSRTAPPAVVALGIDRREMARAIADVYEAFAWRRLSQPFAHCECCVSREMAERWTRLPLRRLRPGDLWAVMSNVAATAGTREDVLYFTPRILEHAAVEYSTLDLAWAFTSLQDSDAPKLAQAERIALALYFRLVWDASRDGRYEGSLNVASLGFVTAVLLGDAAEYFQTWSGHPALLTFLSTGSTDAFWNRNGEPYRRMRDWFRTNETSVRAALDLAGAGSEQAHRLQIALKRL